MCYDLFGSYVRSTSRDKKTLTNFDQVPSAARVCVHTADGRKEGEERVGRESRRAHPVLARFAAGRGFDGWQRTHRYDDSIPFTRLSNSSSVISLVWGSAQST